MKKNSLCIVAFLFGLAHASVVVAEGININQIQFVGSHNSYKQAMPDGFVKQIMKVNPEVMESLEYEHVPLAEQLDLGTAGRAKVDGGNAAPHHVVL